MSGDNTTGMKLHRAYKRLLIAVKEDAPKTVITKLLNEYESLAEEYITLGEILRESRKYMIHYQSGRAVLISKNTAMFDKLSDEGDIARESKNDRILRRKLQNKSLESEDY